MQKITKGFFIGEDYEIVQLSDEFYESFNLLDFYIKIVEATNGELGFHGCTNEIQYTYSENKLTEPTIIRKNIIAFGGIDLYEEINLSYERTENPYLAMIPNHIIRVIGKGCLKEQITDFVTTYIEKYKL